MTNPSDATSSPNQPERYLTAVEVAELMGFTAHTIRIKARNREIPGHQVNRAWRFLWSEIEAQRAAQDPWRRSPQSRARRATQERQRRQKGDFGQ